MRCEKGRGVIWRWGRTSLAFSPVWPLQDPCNLPATGVCNWGLQLASQRQLKLATSCAPIFSKSDLHDRRSTARASAGRHVRPPPSPSPPPTQTLARGTAPSPPPSQQRHLRNRSTLLSVVCPTPSLLAEPRHACMPGARGARSAARWKTRRGCEVQARRRRRLRCGARPSWLEQATVGVLALASDRSLR